MDANLFEAFKGIENAISTPRFFDWLMLGVAFANVIAFVILTIYIAKLNKKVSKNQEDLQKRNLKLQLFEKRYPMYLAVMNSYINSYINIEYVISKNFYPILKEEFEFELNKNLDELKYNNLFAKLLFGDSFNDLKFLEVRLGYLIESISDLKAYIKSNSNDVNNFAIKYNSFKDKENFDFNLWSERCTWPILDKILIYSNAQKEYCKYIEDSNILEKLREYLNVHDLEN